MKKGQAQRPRPGDYPIAKGHYVYGLVDPRNGTVRYVGKVHGYITSRFRRHLYEAKHDSRRNHRLNWLRDLIKNNLEPGVIVLATGDASNLVELEKHWIKRLRQEGVDLTNGTDGGEGMLNPGEDTREKLRKRPQSLRGFTPAQREKARESLKKKWADPEYRVRREQLRLERYGPKKTKLQGEALCQFKIDNAKKMGANNKGKPKSEEHRKKLSEGVKRAYEEGRLVSAFSRLRASPDFKNAHLAGQQSRRERERLAKEVVS